MATKKINYPLAMTTDAKKSKSKLKKMKPGKFLKTARTLHQGEGDRAIIDKFKKDIKLGEAMGPLKLYADGTEDGRHRATAAEELGVDEVPVIDERTSKAVGGAMQGALASTDPNKFMQDIMKFSFQILPLIKAQYLKEVPRQGFADGGAPQRFAAMDPSMLVGASPQPFRGGEAYTDVGGQSIAAPFVKSMTGGYPVYTPHDEPVPSKISGDLPGGKNPFEDWLQFSWLSKLMGYADGGSVEFAPPEVEQALKTASEVAKSPRPFEEEKKYEPFSVLPLSEDKEGIHFDPYAGLLGAVTRPAKYFYETMSGQKEMEPTSEEAIRAATDLAGSLVGGSAAFERPAGSLASGASRVTNPIGMHSIGADAARALPQEKGTPEQVLAMLRKTVPEHEIEHSGIAEEIAGLPLVNREDIAKHFESKLPQVTETIHTAGPEQNVYRPGEAFSDQFNAHHDAMKQYRNDFAEDQYDLPYDRLDEGRQQRIDEIILEQAIDTAQEENLPIHPGSPVSGGVAQFQQYSLPGGSNYREVVLHEPQQVVSPDAGEWYPGINTKPSGYQSSHYPNVSNYLAHVRMKDYELPEGGKGLLLDEVQSDRAQAGRKKGFKTPEHDVQSDKLAAQINDISQQKRDLANRIYRGYNDWAAKEIDEGRRPMPAGELLDQAQSAGMSDLYNRMEVLDDQELALHAERNKLRSAVPSGPYMQDTNHWTDLAIKRALKEAVEGGYNRLMVTPGKEQAYRYNMRKVLDRLSYSPDTGELYGLKNNELKVKKVIPKEELESHVGKEIAQRLLEAEPKMANNQAWHVLEDEGLEVGGHGMKGFYDKKLLGRLEKIIRKYDKKAKIEPYELPTTGEEKRTVHSVPIPDELRRIIQEKGISAFARGGALDLARSIMKGDHHV